MNIEYIVRASFVKRWTIVPTLFQQDLAQHSFNVAQIARTIARAIGGDEGAVAIMALDHDLEEVFTGDIPTPAKESNGADTEPMSVHHKILKLADLMDAYWFISQFGVGWHSDEVKRDAGDRLNSYLKKHFCEGERRVIEKEVLIPLLGGGR